nr:unnamed protein product [Callosobruchus chinensis]
MRVLLVVVLVSVAAGSVRLADAKRKRNKFEGDFEFAEELGMHEILKQKTLSTVHPSGPSQVQLAAVTSLHCNFAENSRSTTGGDNGMGDLCRPLNCKKKEICLLEDTFTAVCVSRKELKKNGDIVVPKPSTQAEESKDEEDDDVFYDTEDEPESDSEDEGDSGLVDLGQSGGSGGGGGAKTLSRSVPSFPVSKPEQLYTYTPQDFKYDNKHYKYIKYTKYNNNKEMSGGGNAIYSEDKERMRGYNEVLEDDKVAGVAKDKLQASLASLASSPPMYPMQKQCSPAALQAMGNRLLDWFSVVMMDTANRKRRLFFNTNAKGGVAAVHMTAMAASASSSTALNVAGCKKPEVKWMFEHLDANGDGRLSLQELYDLEHDQREACLKPFLQRCDPDRDAAVSALEWCRCFQRTERPCKAVARKILHAAAKTAAAAAAATTRDDHQLPGVYVPECDGQGYYKPIQCHSAIGMCWCVDKHGVEYANTRTHGKPNCDPLASKENELSKQVSSNSVDNNSGDSDDEDDHDQDVEGSADHPSDY